MRVASCKQSGSDAAVEARGQAHNGFDRDGVGFGAHIVDLERFHEERVFAVELVQQLEAFETCCLVHVGWPALPPQPI